jgi:hypothetical protein
MKLGRGIRIALVAVTLFGQFTLPVAHDARVITGNHPVLASADDSSASASRHALAGHDSSVCPICLVLSQTRSGIGRMPPTGFFQLVSVTALGHEIRLVPPRTPDLVAAPPRAPPIHSLAFA